MGLGITFSAGNKLYASDLQALVTQIDSLTAPGWTDYSASFTLTATTTNPTKGNSTYAAFYRRPSGADLIHVKIRITIGSTFSAGSGQYLFKVPVAANSGVSGLIVGSGYILDTGTADRGSVTVQTSDVNNVRMFIGTAAVTNSSPQTWATNDQISLDFAYRPA